MSTPPLPSDLAGGSLVLAALVDRLPEDLSSLVGDLPRRLPELGPPRVEGRPGEPVFLLHAGGQTVWALAMDVPLPQQALHQAVFLSNWPAPLKEPLYAHRAHVLLVHKGGGDDPVARLSLLYALAAGLRPLGVADEAAATCVPGPALESVASPEFLAAAREDVPVGVWCGVLKFHREDGQTWYVTRGFDRFGVPDLAFLAPRGQGEDALDLFHVLLNYQHDSGRVFQAGDTAQMGDDLLTFGEPYEYADHLAGGRDVLTVSVVR